MTKSELYNSKRPKIPVRVILSNIFICNQKIRTIPDWYNLRTSINVRRIELNANSANIRAAEDFNPSKYLGFGH
jgi:hypothetical protein